VFGVAFLSNKLLQLADGLVHLAESFVALRVPLLQVLQNLPQVALRFTLLSIKVGTCRLQSEDRAAQSRKVDIKRRCLG